MVVWTIRQSIFSHLVDIGLGCGMLLDMTRAEALNVLSLACLTYSIDGS